MTEIRKLKCDFQTRFKDCCAHKPFFELFSNPFDIDLSKVPTLYKLEILDLKQDPELKGQFLARTIIDFYQMSLPAQEFPKLKALALRIVSLFGSIYRAEQLFSKMKHVKSGTRNLLTDSHLQDIYSF